MTCECCKAPIGVGSQFIVFAGRPWRTEHLVRYKQQRAKLRRR